jgi:hypothetical protein
MKKITWILGFLLIATYSFGQHAEKVRKTAMAMLKANEQKDYDAYVNFFYPAELKYRGGKAKWLQQMKTNDIDLKALGVSLGKQSLGGVSKIYKAGKELHCLIDWNIERKKYINREHFLAISCDHGKTWKFIMTSGKTPSEVWAMVPKFNESLTWVDYRQDI